jgi:AcrR family transcriptional regulator
MSPKAVNKEERRAKIATSALSLFIQNGFESTSMSQVAAAAGIGKGTIYEYFESREELVVAALKLWVERINDEAERPFSASDDPIEHLRGYCQLVTEMFISDDSLARAMVSLFQLMLGDSGELLAKYEFSRELMEAPRRTVSAILLEGVAKGCFRPDVARHVEKIAINLIAYLDGIGMHYWLSNNYFDIKVQVDLHIDSLIENLRPEGPDRGAR